MKESRPENTEAIAIKLNLKAARINAKLSQTEASKQIGVSQGTLSAWEHGRRSPTVMQGYALAECYRIPMGNIDFCSENQL